MERDEMKSKQELTIEQMQHLKELGVDTSKASMCWVCLTKQPFLSFYYKDYPKDDKKVIPTFTLQDIFDLLPSKHEGAYLTITKPDKSYIMGYEDEDGGASPVFINEQAIDSAYEMLCWCAENGYVKTKKDKS